jgi:GTP-binding protein HflX
VQRRINQLERQIATMRTTRATQRKARRRSGLPAVALVGYTNAGKSSLLNSLTDADVLAEDQLFATLDSTTRKLTLPEGRVVTLTDTVGFIDRLPHGLVEAFRSTLDEVREADLLLHVVDASHTQRTAQIAAVEEVLHEIGAAEQPSIRVYNKCDATDEATLAVLRRRHPHAAFTSATDCTGLEDLRVKIGAEAARHSVSLTVLVPYTRGDVVQAAHERAQVVSEEHLPEGTRIMLRVPEGLADLFAEFQT